MQNDAVFSLIRASSGFGIMHDIFCHHDCVFLFIAADCEYINYIKGIFIYVFF